MSSKYTTDRQITSYLRPKNHALFSAYAASQELGNSEAVNVMVEKFFEGWSSEDKMRLLNETKPKNDKATWPV